MGGAGRRIQRFGPRAAILLAVSCGLTATLVSIWVFQPYFGNMDDSVHMELASEAGPWVFHHSGDPATGFLRHSAWVIEWPQYAIAAVMHGPTWLYGLNALVVFAVLLVLGLACRSYFGWTRGSAYVTLVGGALAWPYFSEILVFPSLSEKTVMLGVGLLLWWSGSARLSHRRWIALILLLGVTAVAFTSKLQIVTFVPGLVAALWLGPSWARATHVWRITATALWAAASIYLLALALTADYASSTQGTAGLAAVYDRRLLLLLGLTGAYGVALAIRWKWSSLDPRALIPLIWLATSCGAFFVWEMRNYYLSLAAVGVGVAAAQVASWIEPRSLSIVIASLALATGILMTVSRTATMFSITGSFRDFLTSPMARELDTQAAEVGVGCTEAPTHFNRYAQWMGLDSMTFYDATRGRRESSPWLLADDRLCPLSVPTDSAATWRSTSAPGYVLRKVTGMHESLSEERDSRPARNRSDRS